MYDEITQALFEKQDAYDAEVYADPSLQSKWNEWVAAELDRLEAYAASKIQF